MAQLASYSRFKAVGDDNLPLVGGFVYSYIPGTSTPKDTYTDHTLGTAHTNPVELDALGEETIFIDGDTDLVLEDASHVQRWGPIRATDGSINGVLENATLSGTLTISSSAMTWSGNPTIAGNVTFANNVTIQGGTLDMANGNIAGPVTIEPPNNTFTPGVTFGGNAVGVTYNINRGGFYQEVGDLCYFYLQMRLSSKGSSTGEVRITGLPIPCVTGNVGVVTFPLTVHATGLTGLTGALSATVADPSGGTTLIALYQSAADGDTDTLTDADFTNSASIRVSGFYPI